MQRGHKGCFSFTATSIICNTAHTFVGNFAYSRSEFCAFLKIKLLKFCLHWKFAGGDPSPHHITVERAVSKMGLDKQTNTHSASGHQWLCTKFPFKGSPSGQTARRHNPRPLWSAHSKCLLARLLRVASQPFGLLERRSAPLPRPEVERQHLVVLAAFHKAAAALAFLPDGARFRAGFSKSSVALSRSGVSLVRADLTVGGVASVHSFYFRHTDEKSGEQCLCQK